MITMDQHTCPRCLDGIPNNARRGEYPGALSRTDNKTEVCSACGEREALEQFHFGSPLPQSLWQVIAAITKG